MFLRPNICNHAGLTVSTNSVLEKVGKFTLSIWNMIFLIVSRSDHNLLEEGKGFVNIVSFSHSIHSIKFFSSLVTSEINKMKFRYNDLLSALSSSFGFNKNSVNCMRS